MSAASNSACGHLAELISEAPSSAVLEAEAAGEAFDAAESDFADDMLPTWLVVLAVALPISAVADVLPYDHTSPLSGGKVVITAAGSVTSVVALTFFVFTHRQLGLLLVVQSAVPALADSYVTRKFCALFVFVAAMLASGVGSPLAQCV